MTFIILTPPNYLDFLIATPATIQITEKLFFANKVLSYQNENIILVLSITFYLIISFKFTNTMLYDKTNLLIIF